VHNRRDTRQGLRKKIASGGDGSPSSLHASSEEGLSNAGRSGVRGEKKEFQHHSSSKSKILDMKKYKDNPGGKEKPRHLRDNRSAVETRWGP